MKSSLSIPRRRGARVWRGPSYGTRLTPALYRLMLMSRRRVRMHVSDAKVAANRANARRSTGPRTEGGRRRSSQNAVRHGLFGRAAVLEGEERKAYLEFTRPLIDSLEPKTPMEGRLAERIADHEWRLMRIEAITEALLAPEPDPGEEERDPVYAAAREFRERPVGLATLSLYEQRLARGAREA